MAQWLASCTTPQWKARALGVLRHAGHAQLGMGERTLEDGAGTCAAGRVGPVAPPGQAAGKDQHVVGVVGDGVRVGCPRRLSSVCDGPERCDDESRPPR